MRAILKVTDTSRVRGSVPVPSYMPDQHYIGEITYGRKFYISDIEVQHTSEGSYAVIRVPITSIQRELEAGNAEEELPLHYVIPAP